MKLLKSMWDEIKRAIKFFLENEEGEKTRKIVITGFISIFFLILLNRYFIYNLVDLDHFFIHSALARLLFLNNISPYSADIISVLENFFSTRPVEPMLGLFKFADPIFQLFIYFPLSLITDPRWSAAVFMTISQSLIAGILEVIYRLLDWKPAWKVRLLNGAIAYLSYLGILFFFNPDLTVIQTIIFLNGLYFSLKEKPILAGILLGLSLISFSIIILPISILIAFLIISNRKSPVIWFLISVVLLSLAGVIFDSNWPLRMLRNFFIEPQYFPFTPYSSAVGISAEGAILPAIVNFVPVILISLVVLEWLRMPKVSDHHLYWLLAFVINMNPLFIVSNNFEPSFITIFVYFFIFYLWIFRSEGKVKLYLLAIFLFIAVLLPGLGKIFPVSLSFLNLSMGYNLLLIFLTLLMLYWVRWWVLQSPFDRENFED